MRKLLKSFLILAESLGCSVSSAQMAEEVWTLVINDQSGKVTLFKMGSKAYVDVERLAQIAQGSISFEGNRINLGSCSTDLPEAEKGDAGQHTEMSMSREFIKASIEEISLMREWASTLANAVQNGHPGGRKLDRKLSGTGADGTSSDVCGDFQRRGPKRVSVVKP